MTSDLYSKNSLMGNWYEERLAPEQPFRSNTLKYKIRETEDAISYPAQEGKLKPLPVMKRFPQWITQGVVVDDGFTAGEKLAYPENNQSSIQTNTYKQPNFQKLLEIHHDDQNYATTQAINKFKNKFKSQRENSTQFYKNTTYNDFYGKRSISQEKNYIDPKTKQILQTENNLETLSRYAGTYERDLAGQSLKATSTLTGEKFKDNPVEPKDNTEIQRSWVPLKDQSLEAAKKNLYRNNTINASRSFAPLDPMQTYKKNMDQVKDFDIATSLPMKDGEYALKKKYYNPGEFRHIRQDVTLIRNSIITKK